MMLSIIIPNFNTKKLLQNCLQSIFGQTKQIKFEVMVVDNASTDGSVKEVKNLKLKIKNRNAELKVIINSHNLGYARANNQGIKQAKGEYILFLNSDTVVLGQAIEKALDFLKQRQDIDILGCQLLNKDKSIQPSAGFFPHLLRVFNWMFFIDELPFLKKIMKPYQQSQLSFYQKDQQPDWVTGAFMLIKRRVFDQVKGFDEKFFMYNEEVDFCFRAKKKGFKIWFYSGAQIIHLKGKSSAEGTRVAILGEYQGIKKFYQKNYPQWQLPILRLCLKIGALLRIFIFGILKKDLDKKEIYAQAFQMA